jgi:hypothetical protein
MGKWEDFMQNKSLLHPTGRMETMRCMLSLETSNPIWQVFPDPATGWLVVESRKSGGAFPFISLLDTSSFQLRYQENLLEASGLISLKACFKGLLTASLYTDKELPISRGVIVYDVLHLAPIWQRPDLRLLHCQQHYLNCRDMQGQSLGLELATGRSIHPPERIEEDPFGYPVHFGEGPQAELLGRFLKKVFPQENSYFPAFDYAERNGFIVLSYYLYHQNKLDHFLLVSDAGGTLLLHQLIGSQLPGPGASTFLIWNRFLIFVQFNHQLCIYEFP